MILAFYPSDHCLSKQLYWVTWLKIQELWQKLYKLLHLVNIQIVEAFYFISFGKKEVLILIQICILRSIWSVILNFLRFQNLASWTSYIHQKNLSFPTHQWLGAKQHSQEYLNTKNLNITLWSKEIKSINFFIRRLKFITDFNGFLCLLWLKLIIFKVKWYYHLPQLFLKIILSITWFLFFCLIM